MRSFIYHLLPDVCEGLCAVWSSPQEPASLKTSTVTSSTTALLGFWALLERTGFADEAVAYLLFSQAKVDLRVVMTSHLEVDIWAPCNMCSGQEV